MKKYVFIYDECADLPCLWSTRTARLERRRRSPSCSQSLLPWESQMKEGDVKRKIGQYMHAYMAGIGEVTKIGSGNWLLHITWKLRSSSSHKHFFTPPTHLCLCDSSGRVCLSVCLSVRIFICPSVRHFPSR